MPPQSRDRVRRTRRASAAARWRRVLGTALAGLLVGLLAAPPALAAPRGAKVKKGRARIVQKGNKTRIKASRNAVIRWESFDLAKGEKVRFIQPGKKARVLNRVKGQGPTRIEGRIKANGRVYVLNSAGIELGKDVVVDVGGLVAAAGRLRTRHFLSGVDRFHGLEGRVENRGSIQADSIALLGRQVANHGTLSADEGDVAVVAGDEVWLGNPDSYVQIKMGAMTDEGTGGADVGPAVENTGRIESRRGRVRLAAGDGLGLALREASRVRARRIDVEAETVAVSGSLDASDLERGGRGGRIEVLGEEVAIEGAILDASGDAGGGEIRVGGGIQGGEGLRRAWLTDVDGESTVRADAVRRGDGGRVAIWADGATWVAGDVTARGGERGGDGGFVETSAKGVLQVLKAARVDAPEGEAGIWLLDPSDVRIIDGDIGDGDLDEEQGARRLLLTTIQTDSSEGPPATVSNATISEALSQGSTVLVTTDTFNAEGEDVGDITVEGAIEVESPTENSATLYLLASNDIIIEEDIRVLDPDGTSEFALTLILVANDNELSLLSQNVQSDLSNIDPINQADTTVQPEKNQEQRGLTGNRFAELGDLVIEDGVSIELGGGSITGQGRDIRLEGSGTIDTDGGGIFLIAQNPVRARDRVTNGAGTLSVEKDIVTNGGFIQLQARGKTEIDGTIDITDDEGRSGPGVIDGKRVRIRAPITFGDSSFTIGRVGAAGAVDTQEVILDPGPGGIVGGDDIFLRGGDQTIEGTLSNCPDVTCADRSLPTDPYVISIQATNLTVESGATATLGAADSVLIDLDEALDVQGTLDLQAVTESRIRSGRDLTDAVADEAGPDAGSMVFSATSRITGESVTLRAGDGRTEDRDEIAAEDPLDPRLNASITLPDGVVDPAVESLRMIQDGAFDDAGNQTVPVTAAGADIVLQSADSTLTIQDPTTAARIADRELTLRSALRPEILQTLSPTTLTLEVDGDLDLDEPLAAELRPTSSLTVQAGAAGTGNLVLGDADDTNPTTVIAADEITLRAGDGVNGETESLIEWASTDVLFQSSDTTASVQPDSISWRQDATIQSTTIDPDPDDADFGLRDVIAPPAAPGDPLGLGFRSDDGRVRLVDARDELVGVDLSIAARNNIQLPDLDPDDGELPDDPFLVRSIDIGGVGAFNVTQEVIDSFEFTDPAQSRVTLRSGLGLNGDLTFRDAAPVVIAANEIRLEAIPDVPGGDGGGSILTLSGVAPLPPEYRALDAGGNPDPDANPTTFVMHQRTRLLESQIPEPEQFADIDAVPDGQGDYPDSVALRSDFVSSSTPSIVLTELNDEGTQLQLLPERPDQLLVLSGPSVGLFSETPEGATTAVDLDFAGLPGDVVVRSDEGFYEAFQDVAIEEIAPIVDASDNLFLAGYDVEDAFARVSDPAAGLSVDDVFDAGSDTSPESVLMAHEGNWTLDLLPLESAYGTGDLGDNGQSADGARAVGIGLETTRAGIDIDPGGDTALLDRINDSRLNLNVRVNNSGVSAVQDDDGNTVPRTILFGPDLYRFEAFNARARKSMVIGRTEGLVGIEVLEELTLQAGANGRSGNNLVFVEQVALKGETIRLIAGDSFESVSDDDETPPRIVFDPAAVIGFSFEGETEITTSDDTVFEFRQDASIQESDLPDPDNVVILGDGVLDFQEVESEEGSIELGSFGRLPARNVLIASSSLGGGENSSITFDGTDLRFAPDGSVDDPLANLEDLILRADEVRFIEQSDDNDIVIGGTPIFMVGGAGAGTRPQLFVIEQNASISGADTMPSPGQLGASITPNENDGIANVILTSNDGDVSIDQGLADRVLQSQLFLSGGNDVVFDAEPGAREHTLDLVDLVALAGRNIVLASPDEDGATSSIRTQSVLGFGGKGAQIYQSPVVVRTDSRLLGDQIRFRGTVNDDAAAGQFGRLAVKVQNLVRFRRDVGTTAPLDKLRVVLAQRPFSEPSLFLGALSNDEDSEFILRTSGDLVVDRANPDTPVQPVLRGEGGTILLESENRHVFLGEKVKFQNDGDVTIRSRADGGIVEIADVTVAGRLTLDADQVRIRRREQGRMVRADGADVTDTGTTISANELVIESNDIELSDRGRDPLFGLPDPLSAPDVLRGDDGSLLYPVAALNRGFEPIDSNDLFIDGASDPFVMVRPEGPTAADLAQYLPTDPDRSSQTMPVLWAALDDRALDTVGIQRRSPTALERRSGWRGAGIYDDVRRPTIPVRVASPRLVADAANEAAAAYDRLFGPDAVHAPKIRELLQGALDDYKQETRVRRVVGFEFRRYVKNRPSSQFAAHQALEELDRLFRNHRNSGLARSEYREVQSRWLEAILPVGIDRDELSEAIHPSRYVRGSDILDIFGD